MRNGSGSIPAGVWIWSGRPCKLLRFASKRVRVCVPRRTTFTVRHAYAHPLRHWFVRDGGWRSVIVTRVGDRSIPVSSTRLGADRGS